MPGGFHLIAPRLLPFLRRACLRTRSEPPSPPLLSLLSPLICRRRSKEGRRFAPVKKWSRSLPLLVPCNIVTRPLRHALGQIQSQSLMTSVIHWTWYKRNPPLTIYNSNEQKEVFPLGNRFPISGSETPTGAIEWRFVRRK